jgi:hypothetical protein
MPECPSGKVCIQVCPESLPSIWTFLYN